MWLQNAFIRLLVFLLRKKHIAYIFLLFNLSVIRKESSALQHWGLMEFCS